MKGVDTTKSGDILKEWLSENSEITLPEENRTKLLDLLKRLEKNDAHLRDVKKMGIDKACEWLKVRNVLTDASLEGFRKAMEEARDRNKPAQSWRERAKIEVEHAEELTIERAYELGKIRGKKDTIDKACEYLRNRRSWDYYNDEECDLMSEDEIKDFRKAMEGKV